MKILASIIKIGLLAVLLLSSLNCLNAAKLKSKSPPISIEAITPCGMVDEKKLLQNSQLPDIVEGSASAPVRIVEYYSLTCGHCAEFYINDLPVIRRKYIATGKVRFISREFPYDPRATAAFMLARCVPNGNYKNFVHVLFSKFMDWVPVDNALPVLKKIAALSGVDDKHFKACLADQNLLKKVNNCFTVGQKEFGVTASPTFFINGEKYVGALTAPELSKIIDNLLKHV